VGETPRLLEEALSLQREEKKYPSVAPHRLPARQGKKSEGVAIMNTNCILKRERSKKCAYASESKLQKLTGQAPSPNENRFKKTPKRKNNLQKFEDLRGGDNNRIDPLPLSGKRKVLFFCF